MTRFYFDIHDGDALTEGEDGTEMGDVRKKAVGVLAASHPT